MDTLSFKTISVNKETAKKEWVVIDATDPLIRILVVLQLAQLILNHCLCLFLQHLCLVYLLELIVTHLMHLGKLLGILYL